MKKNDLNLSLDGETFESLKDDFDTILARTVGNMQMKGAENATITIKLDVNLEKDKVDTYKGIFDVTKPSFKHSISSVMQVKDKMSGQLVGDFAMVWDEDEQKYVLRYIDDGQINMFDGDEVVEADYVEVPVRALEPHEEETVKVSDGCDDCDSEETSDSYEYEEPEA